VNTSLERRGGKRREENVGMEDRPHAESSKSRGRCRRLDVTAVGHGGVEQTTWSVQTSRLAVR